jgi:hypothetical protein
LVQFLTSYSSMYNSYLIIYKIYNLIQFEKIRNLIITGTALMFPITSVQNWQSFFEGP